MRKPGLLSAIALAVIASSQGQAVKDPARPNPVRVSSRLQLVASLQQASVKIGDPVKLDLHFKNVSSGVVGTSQNSWENDYWLTVTDASGTALPRTKEGDQMLKPVRALVSSVISPVPPGAEYGGGVVNVAEYFVLDRPGKYFVRIGYRSLTPAPGEPRPKTEKERQEVPLEEAVSELIPFTIVP
jgi:hypothetical protein